MNLESFCFDSFRNYHFVTVDNQDEITARVKGWLDILNIDKNSVDFEKLRSCNVSEENIRIFRRDAERTYVPKESSEVQLRTKARQDVHVDTLKLIVGEVEDYHQGLGYITAFLGLFLEKEDVVRIALCLHRDPKYCSGYFKGAPQNFVADCRVFFKILQKKHLNIYKHLSSKGVLPEMFATKWFVGLGLHVLPYSALFDFYENFFTHGSEYLFKFALAYIEKFESELMAASSTHSQMTILRAEDDKADWKLPPMLLQRHLEEQVFDAIVNDALNIELEFDFEDMKVQERTIVAAAVAAALKKDQELKDLYSDDEIVFTDDEDE